jgi:hypothetical protein
MPLFNIVITKASNDSAFSNDCCPFDFGSVMGQEDLYREDPPGDRVENTLQARIVWGTTVPATSRVIWGQIDEVGFPNDTGVVASGQVFHEVFFPVNQVNTEYKFQIISTSDVCDPGGETAQSGTFYFAVGGEIVVGTDDFELSVHFAYLSGTTLSINLEEKVMAEYFEEIEDVISPLDYELGTAFAVTSINHSSQSDLGDSELRTNYATQVS